METMFFIAIELTSLFIFRTSLFTSLLKLKEYRPTPDIRIGLNAMKNFGRFAVKFAVLYWIQVQYGDAEAWIDAFQRN